MPKHLTKAQFKRYSKRYALDRDPDDLGCVPTLKPQEVKDVVQKRKEETK